MLMIQVAESRSRLQRGLEVDQIHEFSASRAVRGSVSQRIEAPRGTSLSLRALGGSIQCIAPAWCQAMVHCTKMWISLCVVRRGKCPA